MSPDLLAPLVPGPSDPFDRRKAAHLLRRAGFGASPAAIDRAVAEGMEATVENLFDEATDEEDAYQKTFEAINGRLMNFGEIEPEQAWWVYRMMTTRAPLREKLTLFWHGHFATGYEKVDSPRLMHQQIETIRRHAWGNIRELTLAIARDPAMVVWLDGESSTKEHPNENFARELMELFTCGIGHYTETDVQEAARAFTGWHRDGAEFVFQADDHDPGRKHFLGKSGRFDGGDVIDILMQQPATLHFLARKLLRFFAAPEPPEPVVAAAAELLDRTRLDVKWFLRELFQSRYFYSPECYRTRIASPAEFVDRHDPHPRRPLVRPRSGRVPRPDGPAPVRPAQCQGMGRRTEMDQFEHLGGARRLRADHRAARRRRRVRSRPRHLTASSRRTSKIPSGSSTPSPRSSSRTTCPPRPAATWPSSSSPATRDATWKRSATTTTSAGRKPAGAWG